MDSGIRLSFNCLSTTSIVMRTISAEAEATSECLTTSMFNIYVLMMHGASMPSPKIIKV